MKKILFITTGGTIASAPGEGGAGPCPVRGGFIAGGARVSPPLPH